MWERNPEGFLSAYGMSMRSGKLFRCTAEHLIARSVGGKDTSLNIVAACEFCNRSRHRADKPKEWGDYRIYVRRRVALGRWNAHTLCGVTTVRV